MSERLERTKERLLAQCREAQSLLPDRDRLMGEPAHIVINEDAIISLMTAVVYGHRIIADALSGEGISISEMGDYFSALLAFSRDVGREGVDLDCTLQWIDESCPTIRLEPMA